MRTNDPFPFRKHIQMIACVCAGAIMAVAYVSTVGTGAVLIKPGIIEGSQFRLVDDKGNVRGIWGTTEGKVALNLYDANQIPRILLVVDESPRILVYGEDKKVALEVFQHKDNGIDLTLFDQLQRERIALSATKSASIFRVVDARGVTRVEAVCHADDSVKLCVMDQTEKEVWQSKTGPGRGEKKEPPQ
ncbi:MAG: hypothetical protein H7210_05795 [Pyrinomonadaceae bacterium]|nr:hypothetical protein [Phycisphaerales bacterium]